MNRNLPHAEYLIRTALSLDTPNQAGAVAHALDAARLLVDPERTFGLVLRRTPSGGWARVAEQLTDLEHQAVAWDHACERAGLVAATVRRHIGAHPDVHDIRADGDCVRIELHVADLEQWRRWRAHFGIRHDAETPSRHAVAGESRHAGVRVSVLAFTRQQPPSPPSPTAPAAPAAPDSDPRMYEYEGIVYDLTVPQRDVHGDVWRFHGSRTPDGMPLVSLDGRSERCTLLNVVNLLGPLTALTPQTASAPTPLAAAPMAAVRRPQAVRLASARLTVVPTTAPEPASAVVPPPVAPAPEPSSSAAPASASNGPHESNTRHPGLVRTGPATWEAAERAAARSEK
ncbi:BN159_2729 family protein [Streptomyces sp. NBC_00252]|uniref:BN159_2729 family protein n=1 Tax=Streptomyces sp. NBC_00252 TaxID=2975691 RepID=UPI002E2C302A|nr:BN159_2729 family protein [Streptomyces sp. NBC_00252]